MTQNEHPTRNKTIVRNIIYSFLVYCGSFYLFVAILDPSVFTKPSISPQVTAKRILAVGLGIAAALVFSVWYKKKSAHR